MSHLRPQVIYGAFYRVECTDGETEIVPCSMVAGSTIMAGLTRCVEGDIVSWDVVRGYGCRLSAPGYMDCTDWDVVPLEDQITVDGASQASGDDKFSRETEAWTLLIDQYPEAFEFSHDSTTVHMYCESSACAKAIQEFLQSTAGVRWERDGEFVYLTVGAEEDQKDDEEETGAMSRANSELRQLGFMVEEKG